ncbi:MAG: hypothetical protein ABLQ96_06090, partial [Candidatus Acidiferrum sp.]
MASAEIKNSRPRKWPFVLGVIFLALLVGAAFVYRRAQDLDEWARDWVVRALSERFDSRVELESIHVTAFPEMSVTGNNLAIHYHNRMDVP